MSLGRDFALSLILGLRNVHAVLCHLFPCFDPRFKKNIHCHPAFIIRDINSCRKGYSKGRLKSRESDHFNIQIVFKFHHKTLTKASTVTTATTASKPVATASKPAESFYATCGSLRPLPTSRKHSKPQNSRPKIYFSNRHS